MKIPERTRKTTKFRNEAQKLICFLSDGFKTLIWLDLFYTIKDTFHTTLSLFHQVENHYLNIR